MADTHSSTRSLLMLLMLTAACGDDSDSSTGSRRAAAESGDERDAGDEIKGSRDAGRADAGSRDGGTALGGRSGNGGSERRCDDLLAPLERAGEQGQLVGRVLRITPELNYKGRYDWSVQLFDSKERPVSGASITVKPRMPGHGHGTSPVTVREGDEAGVYELLNVNLYMAGLWQVPLAVTSGETSDRIVFVPCVAEPPDGGAGTDDAGTDDAGIDDAGAE